MLSAQQAQPPCASRVGAGEAAERGWAALRTGATASADAEFQRALKLCPADVSALTGAGYSAMRSGRVADARRFFARAGAIDSSSYDVLAGAGMAAYRAGDMLSARRSFERALVIVHGDSVAMSYLARMPQQFTTDTITLRPRPTTTQIAARTGDRIFEVPDGAGGWTPLWIKAVNLGAALPGKFPSEFPPNDSTYEKWIALMAQMGANTIRVYTLHPPHFYAALRAWNIAHAEHPMWLIHGVWTELPPGRKQERYDDAKWLAQFRDEMRRVVSVLHGEAVIRPVAGHANGLYTADVSRWTLGYIIGREWEPFSVVGYNALRPRRTTYAGRFVKLDTGNAVEAWLAEQCDYLVGFEMDRYNEQRPVAYTNWPTLDPLTHPTETTKAQEVVALKARGETIMQAPKEYDNDAVGLDAVRMQATPAFAAGVFASYHAYPYYPDFLLVDPAYSQAQSPEGPSNYFGYLRELVKHHGAMPVVISEYGVPSSRGVAHLQPQGWNHGGLSEQQQAAANARLTRDIHAAGAAGAGLFAIIDEWFKKNWLVSEFEVPAERKRLWFNVLDAEENYGVISMKAGNAESGVIVDGDSSDWHGHAALYDAHSEPAPSSSSAPFRLKSFRVTQDEAYVYFRLDVGRIDWTHAHYQVGIDTYRTDLGEVRLPHTGTRSPVGLEFVLDIAGPADTRVLVAHAYNPYKPVAIPGSKPAATQYLENPPFRTVATNGAAWDSVVVVPNRRRISRSGVVFPARSYDRNRLMYARETDNTLADWYADTLTGIIEARIPWGMLQVTDPSSRTVLFGADGGKHPMGKTTDGMRFVVESYDPAIAGAMEQMPRAASGSGFAPPPTWTWPTWEQPRWHTELKAVFKTMQAAFAGIPEHPAPRERP